jgi:hypothetical protein
MTTISTLASLGLVVLLNTQLVAKEISLGNFHAVGRNFSNARLVKKDEQHAMIAHNEGVTKVSLLALPRQVQDRIKFYPEDYSLDAHNDRLQAEKAEEKKQSKLAEVNIAETAKDNHQADLAIQRSIARTENLQQSGDRSFWRGLVQPKDEKKYRLQAYYKSRKARLGNLAN